MSPYDVPTDGESSTVISLDLEPCPNPGRSKSFHVKQPGSEKQTVSSLLAMENSYLNILVQRPPPLEMSDQRLRVPDRFRASIPYTSRFDFQYCYRRWEEPRPAYLKMKGPHLKKSRSISTTITFPYSLT